MNGRACRIWICRADSGLQMALEKADGCVGLAAALGLTPQAVAQWQRVPAGRVIAIEAYTRIPREVLRPDLYGAPRPDYAETRPGAGE